MNFTYVDAAVAVVTLLSAFLAYNRGFTRELFAIGGWVLAAFVLFRHFVRRLRALEELANRVTEGDLTARVSDLGQDEIGRLGERLNVMTESLSTARRRIEEEDRARRRLVADISHELATPMTSIQGYAETLNDPDVPVTEPEQRNFLRSILEETVRLKALIRDLFDLTRLEAGAIPLEREAVDLTELARNTQRRFAPRFEEAGLSLHWQGDAAPAWADLDGRRIEQVVDNLLTNALRYVPEGGCVEMSVAAGAGEHVLTVRDDGPGIPEEHVAQVFERFYRADEARTSEGTGLGLAISREIVERHDGTIVARNRPDGGAEFAVRLPAQSA